MEIIRLKIALFSRYLGMRRPWGENRCTTLDLKLAFKPPPGGFGAFSDWQVEHFPFWLQKCPQI